MKNLYLLACLLLLAAGMAYADAIPSLQRDGDRTAVQGPAPKGELTTVLTAPGTVVDMSTSLGGGLYSSVDCRVRYLPAANSTKSGYVQSVVPGGQYYIRIVNKPVPSAGYTGSVFWHISGCSGVMEKY